MLDIVLDHDEAARRRDEVWQAYAEVADLVVIEQRGYTLRGEMLELSSKPLPLNRPSTPADDIEITLDLARRAQQSYPQADLSGYSIGQIAGDVDDLRRALGYDKISLLAASFGSQWASAVLKSPSWDSSSRSDRFGGAIGLRLRHAFTGIRRLSAHRLGGRPRSPIDALATAGRFDRSNVGYARDRLLGAPVTVAVRDESGGSRKIVLGAEDYQGWSARRGSTRCRISVRSCSKCSMAIMRPGRVTRSPDGLRRSAPD